MDVPSRLDAGRALEARAPAGPAAPDAAEVAKMAETLTSVEDKDLRTALARLGASIKRN